MPDNNVVVDQSNTVSDRVLATCEHWIVLQNKTQLQTKMSWQFYLQAPVFT